MMRAVLLLALSEAVRAIPTVSTPGRQLQSAQPDKCSDDASFQGTEVPAVESPQLRRSRHQLPHTAVRLRA